MQVGIIGMPNVGKSTLLNALTHARAEASNYPFCTIDRNVGVAVLEDRRLAELAAALHPAEVVPATIQFVDIAGLVRGASRGEGLGNRFLGHVREADALLHVVRVFGDEAVVHVSATVDPARDLEIVQTELMLADLETIERSAEKARKSAKGDPKEAAQTLWRLDRLMEVLHRGSPVASLDATADAPALEMARELFLLTQKPMLLVANIDETESAGDLDQHPILPALRAASGTDVVALAIRLEEELSRLAPGERDEMIRDLGLATSGLHRLIEASRQLLGLITFYTIANDKLRAWLIPAGTTAARAAGRIHTDMERGFIRMEVFSHPELLAHGSRTELLRHGLVRIEGREYAVRDGDVVQVLFHAP